MDEFVVPKRHAYGFDLGFREEIDLGLNALRASFKHLKDFINDGLTNFIQQSKRRQPEIFGFRFVKQISQSSFGGCHLMGGFKDFDKGRLPA